MRTVLIVFGVISGFLSLFAFGVGLSNGADIQLIAAGVFGTMSAVCFGFVATLAKMEAPRKETAADLARELLSKWASMEASARERLARSLIARIDSSMDASKLNGTELRDRLSSLIEAKV